MAKKHIAKKQLFASDESIWTEFGIFPEVLSQRADVEKVRLDARAKFAKIGEGNLRFLSEVFGVPVLQDDDKRILAEKLAAKFPNDLLTHVFEFQKRRTFAIENVFKKRYRKAKSVANSVRQYSIKSNEAVHKITKLLLLLKQSEANLRDIFYLASWISRDTNFRFQAKSTSENSLRKKVVDNIDLLSKQLAKCSDLGGERLGFHDLNGRALVIVHLRKYRPRISRDYETTHNLHHVCGTLIVGVSHVDGFLHVKSSSQKVADSVENFLTNDLGLEVERIENQVVSNFNADPLSAILRGKMPDESEFTLQGIALSRTSIGGVPLEIPRDPFNNSILLTLDALHDAGIVGASSPVCLKVLELNYGDEEVRIECESTTGGALRLTYHNAGLTDDFQESLESRFQTEFGVPLNRLLDPSQWNLGTTGIIAFILKAKTKEELQDYQKPIYDGLIEKQIIEECPEDLLVCTSFDCNATMALGEDETDECKRCGSPVKPQKLTIVKICEKGLQKWIRKFLSAKTKWLLGNRNLTFESQKYFPISHLDGGTTERVAAVFQHRMTKEKQLTFDRASMPVVKFSEQYLDPPIRIERDDSATVSIPYLARTIFESGTSRQTGEEVDQILDRVRSTYDSRISRAARLSADRLEHVPTEQTGNKYEIDVFNVSRWLFWFANQMGRTGKREPDGVLSLQDYRESESPTDINTWNLGYDAKFSNAVDGYEFGPEEQRQAIEYIGKYFRAKTNNAKKRLRVLGHAVISNNIESVKIANLVEQLRVQGVISATKASPVICLIRDEFLLALYRELSKDGLNFRKKRLHLHFLMIELLEKTTNHGFLEFGQKVASYMINELAKMEAIEEGITIAELERVSFASPPSSIFTPTCPLPEPTPSQQPSE